MHHSTIDVRRAAPPRSRPQRSPAPRGFALAEVASAVVLALIAVGCVGLRPSLIGLLHLAVVTAPLVRIDITEHRLPNRLVVTGYPVALLGAVCDGAFGRGLGLGLAPVEELGSGAVHVAPMVPVASALTAAAAALLVFGLLHLVGGLGMGDVKLAGLFGLVLGAWRPELVVVALLGSFMLGGVHGAYRLLLGDRSSIAFGPSMLAGFWVAVVFSRVLTG